MFGLKNEFPSWRNIICQSAILLYFQTFEKSNNNAPASGHRLGFGKG